MAEKEALLERIVTSFYLNMDEWDVAWLLDLQGEDPAGDVTDEQTEEAMNILRETFPFLN
jgi:hypothetical protein